MKTASKFFRLPLIRHARYYWHLFWCRLLVKTWASLGIGLGFINKSDREHLEKIWRGEA